MLPRKWVDWIKWCITFASFSVLINGIPTGFFRISKGIGQGDPLSPYLFVLGMEAFSLLIDKAAVGGWGYLTGFKIRGRGGDEKQVTHLLFTDVKS